MKFNFDDGWTFDVCPIGLKLWIDHKEYIDDEDKENAYKWHVLGCHECKGWSK